MEDSRGTLCRNRRLFGTLERLRCGWARQDREGGEGRERAGSPCLFLQGTWRSGGIKLSTLRRRAWLLCASQIVLLWLMPFDARQQFFFQRSPELREPLNFRLAPIEVLDNLGEPLNLHLETIKQINNLAVLVAERVETWVCRHHPAHSLFILGEP